MFGVGFLAITSPVRGRARILGLLCAAPLLCSAGDSRGLGPAELPKTDLSYRIEVRLTPETREVRGLLTLKWTSPARVPIERVPIHLYLNAFSHTGSTWMAGGLRRFDADEHAELYDDPWGYIDVHSVHQNVGDARSPGECTLGFIQPNDGNRFDRSLGEVELATAVRPFGELQLEIAFTSRLPIPIARTGGRDDYFHVGQWFPKLGVYEPKSGQWAARQFHGPTEFYADFADYEVLIDVPSNFDVVATGEGEAGEPDDGFTTWRFTQRAVHDFAFVTGEDLHIETHPHTPKGGGPEIAISYVTPILTAHHVPRMRVAAEMTFDVLGQRVGPYPFTTMKIIQPPWKAGRTAGMEYPTLVTGIMGDPLFDYPGLSGARIMEYVVVHEIIHNYFQGLVANDEQMQAFLDEGFTSYWTREVLHGLGDGKHRWDVMFGFATNSVENRRRGLAEQLEPMQEALVRRPAYLFYPGTHGTQIYTRSTLTFMTAANLFGQQQVDRVFTTYFHRHRFSHPTSDDFLAVVDEVAGPELRDFLHEAFMAHRWPDYRVESAKSERWKPPLGRVYSADGVVTIDLENRQEPNNNRIGLDPAATEDDGKTTMVITDPGYTTQSASRVGGVERRVIEGKKGTAVEGWEAEDDVFYRTHVVLRGARWWHLPVLVRFEFNDGLVVEDTWDGRAAWRAYSFTRGAELRQVQIDPDDDVALDVNRDNDGRRLRPDDAMATSVAVWLWKAVVWVAIGVTWWL